MVTEAVGAPCIAVFVVAFNAETTLAATLGRIPHEFLGRVTYVLVFDDASDDRTWDVARTFAAEHPEMPLVVERHPENRGYGGNQKTGYRWCIDHDVDSVVLVHGDGQYAPEELARMIAPIECDEADLVMGSRMLRRGGAIRGGMPLYKFAGNKVLTFVQNRLAGVRLSEWHSGYRAFRVPLLATIPFESNSDVFDFDTQIILQVLDAGGRIVEVDIPTFYGDEVSYVNGLVYGKDIVRHSLGYWHRRRKHAAADQPVEPATPDHRSARRVRCRTIGDVGATLALKWGNGMIIDGVRARLDPKYLRLRWWREAIGSRVATLRARRSFTEPYVYDKVVEGESFQFFIGDPTAEAWYGRRTDEHDLEMRFVRDEMLRGGDVVIEVGAHHGNDTVLLSRWVGPTGRVFAFEPLADNVEAIKRNLGLNGIENVEVIRAALGANEGTVAMAADSNSHVVIDSRDAPRSGRGDTGVSLVSIDSFCATHGLVPDLIKIDVEGFEFEVLKGAQRTLRDHRPALQIEVHGDQLHRYGTHASALWDLVDAEGYELWLQRNDLVAPEPCLAGAELAGRVHVFFKQRA